MPHACPFARDLDNLLRILIIFFERHDALPARANRNGSRTMANWLYRPQPRLKTAGLIALLIAASLATPLSLDMYTPAVPHMTEYFSTTDAMVNLTMFGYYLFFAVSILLFGPVSDRIGCKPTLIIGTVAYSLAGAGCALSPAIEVLIALRIVQAFGAGAMNAVTTAIVKDAFPADKREKVLSIMQVMFVVGPVVAPIVGAAVLQFADWRMTFWILAAVGAACCAAALLFEETLEREKRFTGSLAGSLLSLASVVKDKGFSAFLGISATQNVAFMAYIAVASHIYITFFGLTDMEYSLFFGGAALATALAPLVWIACSKRLSARRFVSIALCCALASGILMAAFGTLSPFAFFAFIVLFMFTESALRPLSTNILLTQYDGDAGAASSVINFAHTAIGSLGMVLAVMPWPNYVAGISALIVISMAGSAAGWAALVKSRIPLAIVKE